MGALRAAAVVVIALVTQAPPPQTAGGTAGANTSSTRSGQARAAYDKGIEALRGGDLVSAAERFREAIGADPRFLAAHEQLIEAQQESRPQLQALYEGWAAAHPDNPVYEWGLARIAGSGSHASEAHLRRAIAIDPSFARAYADLALAAELNGDTR